MLVCLSSGDVDTGDAASYKQSTQQHSSVSREQQQQPADRLHADRSVLCQSLCHARQVQSHYLEGSPVSKRSLTWEGFAEKVRFEPRVKE